jgi:hypothetical protein
LRGRTNILRPVVVGVILFSISSIDGVSRAPLLITYSKSGIDCTPFIFPKVDLEIPLHTLWASYSRSTTCGAQLFIAYTEVPKQLLMGVRGIIPLKMTLG